MEQIHVKAYVNDFEIDTSDEAERHARIIAEWSGIE